MVSEQKTRDIRGGSAMELRSDIDAATTQKGSHSPPEHMEKQRGNDMSVLASRLEEDFCLCVMHGLSTGMLY